MMAFWTMSSQMASYCFTYLSEQSMSSFAASSLTLLHMPYSRLSDRPSSDSRVCFLAR